MTEQKKRGKVFYDIILPSTGLPEKATYNMQEVAAMFGIHQNTLSKYLKQKIIDLQVIKIYGPRVYKQTLVDFFERTVVPSSEVDFDESDE